MANKETNIQNTIRLELQKRYNLRLYRNNVGEAWQGKSHSTSKGHIVIERPARVKYGLFVGSSDTIGIMPVTITPEMVGKTIGVFLAIEVKTEKGIVSEAQKKFIAVIRDKGGIAGIARSADDAIKIIEEYVNLLKCS